MDSPNRAATWRSARFSAAGSTSVGRQTCAGRPGLAIGSSGTSSPRGGRRASASSPVVGQVVVVVAHAAASSFFLLERVGVGGDPDGEADQRADADQPGEQALAHRADAAEVEAAVLGLLLQRVEVGDDVALLLGRQVAVGEVGIWLRAGQHRLVDVLGLEVPLRSGA